MSVGALRDRVPVGPGRVLVVAPNWLGDAVMSLPAIADVRRHFARARLIVAARASVAPLFALTPLADEVITVSWRARLTDRRVLRDDARRLREAEPEVALLLPNSFASAWLVRAAGIGERWGYAADLRRPLLTRAIARPRRSLHQGAYYQRLTHGLGIASGPLEPSVEPSAPAIDASRHLLRSHGWDGATRLLVMAPGAAYGTAKRWLPEHFARLIATATVGGAFQVVLVGTRDDAATVALIRGMLDADAGGRTIDLTGATTIETLAGVLSVSAACVSNDSGAMHLAGAVGVPLVAVFGPTRERETAPLTRAGARAEVLVNPVWCRPCMLRECPIDHRCMKGLPPERVLAALSRLMGETA